MGDSGIEGARILVTGAGGPAAVSFMHAVTAAGADVWAVDMDPYAAGLYLVPGARRALVPRGDAPHFVDAVLALCQAWRIDVVVPTVDVELIPVARRTDDFDLCGTTVLAPSITTLELCLDKWTLIEHCREVAQVPLTVLLDEHFDVSACSFPLVTKPRRGSGSRGVAIIADPTALGAVPADGSHIAQQLLPGREHSLDVLAYRDGTVAAVVPRTRLKVDSGIAVAGAVEVDAELIEYGRLIADAIGLTSVANVQVKADPLGQPRLLEVNPRFPGSMPLTIAAGVDMPVLAVADALGRPVPSEVPCRPLAFVRTWTETYFPADEFLQEQP